MKPKRSSKIPIKLKKDFQFKKRADFAHKAIHRKGLTHTKKHISGRIDSVKNLNTKRLLFSWTAKFVIILGLAILSFSKLNTASRYEGYINGGSVIVGISDENTKLKLNPLTLSSPAELAIGRLIFSSPLKYDKLGKLQGDAVESYTSEDSGKKIRMVLREGMQWHDGKPLTSEDIVFTISSLKIPRVNSSLRDSLAGIEAVAIDPRVLEISSPKPLAGLDDLMTRIRIAPKHLFDGIESDDLASIDYNELPVGSGPLEVGSFVATKETSTLGIEGAGTFQQLSLNINNNYYGNKAQTDLTLRVFPEKENLQQAFNGGLIEIFVGGGTGTELREGTEEIKLAISSGVFGFYNLNSPGLKDVKVRRALTDYINRQLVSEISGGVKPLYSPVLEIEPAARAMGSVESSQKLITEAGWQFDAARSIFVKDGQDLELNMVTGESDDYIGAAKELVARWKELGVRVNLEIVKSSELQSNYFVNKSYDILLYGISLNEASDPYAYWSSAAATSRGLNFSSYQSAASDADLDVARTKLDPAERRLRLERFVKRWDEDAPAISLYVPSIKVIYNSSTSQPEPNQKTAINNYADGFEFLTEIKAQKKKIYRTD
jgi:peptide/nickel transport system substrate-binding protein